MSIVAPVFREAANIPTLAARVAAAMERHGVAWELILSDDDSNDGTEEVVAGLARRLPVRLHVRRGLPRDLSLAVVDGIRLARFDRLVVMDADLSHRPEQIPRLLAALGDGAEMAVGSRYARGGRIEGLWSLYRNLNSRLATLAARPLVACADPMSGFFALRRRNVPALESLDPLGYKIGLELMVRGRLRVREVPIRFDQRRSGSSKLSWRQQLLYLRHLQRLYLFRFGLVARLLSFAAVGMSGLVVDTAVYVGLERAGVGHVLARFLSFWPAMTWNWGWNRALTFRDRPSPRAAAQWSRFAVSSLIGLLTNVGSYALLTSHVGFFANHRLLALFAGVGIGCAANYATAARFVYRPAPSTRAPA